MCSSLSSSSSRVRPGNEGILPFLRWAVHGLNVPSYASARDMVSSLLLGLTYSLLLMAHLTEMGEMEGHAQNTIALLASPELHIRWCHRHDGQL